MSEEVVEVVETPVEAAPEPSTNYANLINEDGSFKDGFLASLPDDLGSHSSVSKYTNIVDVIKGGMNASSLVSKKASEYWTSDDPDIVAERNSIMGVPSDAAGYELVKPADFPEDIPYDENHLSEFAAFAAENGVSKELAEKLIRFDAERATKVYDVTKTATEEYKQEKIEELRKEWGNKFDYNDAKVTQIADHLGIREVLVDTGLAYEPLVQKMLLEQIGPAINNDKLIEGAKQDNFATLQDNLTDVENRIFKMDPTDPAYKTLVAERTALLDKLP